MFSRKSSRMRFDTNDRYKKYEIWFEVLDGQRVIRQFRIPAQVIINTFKDIALCEERGYSDVMENAEINIGKDIREEMR